MRGVFVGRAGHRKRSAALGICLYRVDSIEHYGSQKMGRVLASIRDDLGRLEPMPDMNRHVALDHWKQVSVERKARQLRAVPTTVV